MRRARKKGISFASRTGNEYVYDDDTGFIYPASHGENRAPYPMSLEVAPLGGGRPPPQDFDGDSIRKHHFDGAYGFRHLILEVTGQCNLRCKYCVYSEH